MARVARMPLADQALAVLGSALRDPNVVLRYQAKFVTVPGSECLWCDLAVDRLAGLEAVESIVEVVRRRQGWHTLERR